MYELWRSLEKKHTANQQYAISYWWLIETVADGPYYVFICEIFPCIRHFHTLYPGYGCPAISTYSINHWKVHLVGYNSVADLKDLSSQICEIMRISEKI